MILGGSPEGAHAKRNRDGDRKRASAAGSDPIQSNPTQPYSTLSTQLWLHRTFENNLRPLLVDLPRLVALWQRDVQVVVVVSDDLWVDAVVRRERHAIKLGVLATLSQHLLKDAGAHCGPRQSSKEPTNNNSSRSRNKTPSQPHPPHGDDDRNDPLKNHTTYALRSADRNQRAHVCKGQRLQEGWNRQPDLLLHENAQIPGRVVHRGGTGRLRRRALAANQTNAHM